MMHTLVIEKKINKRVDMFVRAYGNEVPQMSANKTISLPEKKWGNHV